MHIRTLTPAYKDDRAELVPTQPSAATYREVMERARDRQLDLTKENLDRLARTYDRAAEAVLESVRALPDGAARSGTPWLQARLNLIRQIDEELTRLKTEFRDMLNLSSLASAQEMADREAEVAALVGAPADPRLAATLTRSATFSEGLTVTVQFGQLAQGAVERTVTRYYSDGLVLSDRLYKLDVAMRKTVEDTVVQGLASGASARGIAGELEPALMAAGSANPRYDAMRIARTELNAAFREAAVDAVQSGGQLKPYVQACGWRLSSSHKELDRCDLYAADDGDGLGPGNYLPGNVPVSHPNCLCAVVTVLKAFPEEQFVRLAPNPDGVPVSEVRRLAQQGDAAAQRWMAGRAG